MSRRHPSNHSASSSERKSNATRGKILEREREQELEREREQERERELERELELELELEQERELELELERERELDRIIRITEGLDTNVAAIDGSITSSA